MSSILAVSSGNIALQSFPSPLPSKLATGAVVCILPHHALFFLESCNEWPHRVRSRHNKRILSQKSLIKSVDDQFLPPPTLERAALDGLYYNSHEINPPNRNGTIFCNCHEEMILKN